MYQMSKKTRECINMYMYMYIGIVSLILSLIMGSLTVYGLYERL